MMPAWGQFALCVQLILTLLAPPLLIASRRLFLGDLWLVLWLVPALASFASRPKAFKSRRFLVITAASALVFAIYLHGAVRPSITLPLINVGFTWLRADEDRFDALREAVVALRFLSWLWAAAVVAAWTHPSPRIRLRHLEKTLLFCLSATGFVMLLAKTLPPIDAWLGRVYGYDPNVNPWQGRIYGTFLSPVEGGTTLLLAILLSVVLIGRRNGSPQTYASWLLAAGGIWATRTLTPIIALVASLVVVKAVRRAGKNAAAIGVSGAIVAGVFATWAIRSDHPYIVHKIVDFRYRFGPWRVYLETATSRPDLLLLGTGFTNYHVDNAYLFLLLRGGCATLVAFAFWLSWLFKHCWRDWDDRKRCALLYMLVGGLTLDTFIMRPLVALWIAVGIYALNRADALDDRQNRLHDNG